MTSVYTNIFIRTLALTSLPKSPLLYFVYATAEMLRFRLSELRQSKPSIRTAAGLCPDEIGAHPLTFRAEGEGGATGGNAVIFSLPKCSSWTTGFEALLGGDPLKNGGDEATWLQ